MTDAITKTCAKCGVAKGLECFGKHRLGKSGLQPACRACRAIEKRKYVEKNREKVHASRKAYKSANKDKINAQRREAYAGEGGKRQREYKRRQSESLGESYIRKLLAAATWAPRSAIPLVLIDTHRVHLKIKRLLRQRKPA